jgi:hypothetical protein
LLVYNTTSKRASQSIGWVRFVWGNGKDCLADHSSKFADIIDPVLEKLDVL